jgi:hypothetical protein
MNKYLVTLSSILACLIWIIQEVNTLSFRWQCTLDCLFRHSQMFNSFRKGMNLFLSLHWFELHLRWDLYISIEYPLSSSTVVGRQKVWSLFYHFGIWKSPQLTKSLIKQTHYNLFIKKFLTQNQGNNDKTKGLCSMFLHMYSLNLAMFECPINCIEFEPVLAYQKRHLW